MLSLTTAALLGLALRAMPVQAAPSPPLPACVTGVRHLELEADTRGTPPEVCIHPGLPTTFSFDSKLAHVEVQGDEHFQVLDVGAVSVTLIPSQALADGERVPVRVSFQDGAAPASAQFLLVVHPSGADGQVRVTRHPRTLASYQEGEQQARAEARQCQEDKARLLAEHGASTGLTGLLTSGEMDEKGVAVRILDREITVRPGGLIERRGYARSYRAVGRLAVEVKFWNTGQRPWRPTRASLVGPHRAALQGVTVWTEVPQDQEDRLRVVVEAEAPVGASPGPFTLTLWEDGGESVTLEGVTFP